MAALGWSSLFFLSLTALFTSFLAYFITTSPVAVTFLIAFPILTIVIWSAAYLSRRKAYCPLCKGTPLLDSRASMHSRATRIFPLNYGTTNLLRMLLTRRFRCQFCGSPFDLLKVQSREPGSQ